MAQLHATGWNSRQGFVPVPDLDDAAPDIHYKDYARRVFEGVPGYATADGWNLRQLKRHIRRLLTSGQKLLGVDWLNRLDELCDNFTELVRKNGKAGENIYGRITFSNGTRGYKVGAPVEPEITMVTLDMGTYLRAQGPIGIWWPQILFRDGPFPTDKWIGNYSAPALFKALCDAGLIEAAEVIANSIRTVRRTVVDNVLMAETSGSAVLVELSNGDIWTPGERHLPLPSISLATFEEICAARKVRLLRGDITIGRFRRARRVGVIGSWSGPNIIDRFLVGQHPQAVLPDEQGRIHFPLAGEITEWDVNWTDGETRLHGLAEDYRQFCRGENPLGLSQVDNQLAQQR